jgi:hypothetical protein
MFEFFVGVLKFHGHEDVRFLDANRSALIQALYFVNDCVTISEA